MIKKINFKSAKELLDSNPSALLFDVREEEEFAVKHADSAVPFPVDTIDEAEARFMIPSKQTPVTVYCRTGNRSELASKKLDALGYENVFDLGSMVGWPYGMAYGTI